MSADATSSNDSYRRLFLHSLLAVVLAFLVTTLVHEGSHALTARAFGLHPVLHHNYVSTPDTESFASSVAIPASGPLVSLLQGLLCLALCRRIEPKSVVTLALLWLGVFGLLTFFGYLMMGPLFAYGDTGKVFALLGLPVWVQWLIAVAGLVAVMWILRGTAADFERQTLTPSAGEGRARAKTANLLIAFPLLAAVLVDTLLSLPVPTFLSLLYPLTSPFAVFFAYGKLRRRTAELPPGARYPDGLSWGLLATVAVLVVVTRLLVPGLEL